MTKIALTQRSFYGTQASEPRGTLGQVCPLHGERAGWAQVQPGPETSLEVNAE